MSGLLAFDISSIQGSIVWAALLLGLMSAFSLPLGAATSFFWKPTDRAISFLMAFGSGALLAALTLDLVATAVDHGYFYPLAFGCIVGGLLFVLLNEIVNDYGGFVRKVSTRIYHLRKQEYRRFKKILSSVQKVDIFKELSDQDFKALASSIKYIEVNKGQVIYQQGDPSDNLYIIASGQIELINPKNGSAVKVINAHNVFSWMDFLTGSTSLYKARAIDDASLWVLPRTAFMNLLPYSSTLRQAVHLWLRSPALVNYLKQHELKDKQVSDWAGAAVGSLMRQGHYENVLTVNHRAERFKKIAGKVGRLSLFGCLPAEELELISSKLIYKQLVPGEALFYKNDNADRFYIIERGAVIMLDDNGKTFRLGDNDAFGFMASLTGSRHALSALVHTVTNAWMLRRCDLHELMTELPEFARRVKIYYQCDELKAYLRHYQNISDETILNWSRKVQANIDAGESVTPVSRLVFDINGHKNAPLAIWLGMLLDGIPESLVIGASVSQSHVSLSLIAGLFLANYPEALSSSAGMQDQGMKKKKIMLMWLSLMLITGVIAALGSLFFVGANPSLLAITEGLAAGAMLTMIAQTMLPEAYLKGGEVVGFSTLLGFLVAIFFKTFE